MDLRSFLQDFNAIKHQLTAKATKLFVQNLELKASKVPAGDAQSYVIACVFQQLQAENALSQLGPAFLAKYPPCFPLQFPVPLETLKTLYDTLDDIHIVAAHPKIEDYREAMKDHVLGVKKLPADPGKDAETWQCAVKEHGMINIRGLRSLEQQSSGLLPISKKTLEVFNNVITDKQTAYDYKTDQLTRDTQRIRALQAMYGKLATDFVSTQS
jgi:hypothetical protein